MNTCIGRSWIWQKMLLDPACRKLRQEDLQFNGSLGICISYALICISRPCLKQNKNPEKALEMYSVCVVFRAEAIAYWTWDHQLMRLGGQWAPGLISSLPQCWAFRPAYSKHFTYWATSHPLVLMSHQFLSWYNFIFLLLCFTESLASHSVCGWGWPLKWQEWRVWHSCLACSDFCLL